MLYYLVGRVKESQFETQKQIRTSEEVGLRWAQVLGLSDLAWIDMDRKDYSSFLKHVSRARRLLVHYSSSDHRTWLRVLLARARDAGLFPRGTGPDSYWDLERLDRELDKLHTLKRAIAYALYARAKALRHGRVPGPLSQELKRLYARKTFSQAGIAGPFLRHLAEVYLATGDYRRARIVLNRLLEIARRLGNVGLVKTANTLIKQSSQASCRGFSLPRLLDQRMH